MFANIFLRNLREANFVELLYMRFGNVVGIILDTISYILQYLDSLSSPTLSKYIDHIFAADFLPRRLSNFNWR